MQNEKSRPRTASAIPAFHSAFCILTSSFDSMEIKKGIGVSPGVVISTAVVLDAEDLLIPARHVDPSQIPAEFDRMGKAIAESVVELTRLRDDVAGKHGKEIGGIFDFHLGILRDRTLQAQIQ